jgi:hypothetical protein
LQALQLLQREEKTDYKQIIEYYCGRLLLSRPFFCDSFLSVTPFIFMIKFSSGWQKGVENEKNKNKSRFVAAFTQLGGGRNKGKLWELRADI